MESANVEFWQEAIARTQRELGKTMVTEEDILAYVFRHKLFQPTNAELFGIALEKMQQATKARPRKQTNRQPASLFPAENS